MAQGMRLQPHDTKPHMRIGLIYNRIILANDIVGFNKMIAGEAVSHPMASRDNCLNISFAM